METQSLTWHGRMLLLLFITNSMKPEHDPDVGDAELINDPRLGWYSDGIIIPPIKKRQLGGEIGDIPIEEAQKLGRIFQLYSKNSS